MKGGGKSSPAHSIRVVEVRQRRRRTEKKKKTAGVDAQWKKTIEFLEFVVVVAVLFWIGFRGFR